MAVFAKIVQGPSKHELFKSYESAHNPHHETVKFVTEDNLIFQGYITFLEFEDGSGESFNLHGIFAGTHIDRLYYRTDHRTGTIEIIPAGATIVS